MLANRGISGMTEAVEPPRKSSRRRWLWLLLLLLLLGGGFGYFWLQPRAAAGTAFDLDFKGCDRTGLCADFKLFAPGASYRWVFDTAMFESVDGRRPDMSPAIQSYMDDSVGAIASGLASREGSSEFNRRLSACRSMRLADLLADVAGDTDNIYRVSLGRYVDPAGAPTDTSIERLLVMAFILRTDYGVNLSEALKDGLQRELPTALRSALPGVARQLDFTSYECWDDEFAVTQTDEVRGACYREPSRSYLDFCNDF